MVDILPTRFLLSLFVDCPFTGNCVGLSTFRSFYLWVCFGLLGITYASYISFWPFKYCWYDGIPPHGVDASAKDLYKLEWNHLRGDMCQRLGKGAYLFLPAFFGWMSTLFIFAFQSALIYTDMTTIEYLKGLVKFQVKLSAPTEIRQDQQRRDKRRKAVGATQSDVLIDDTDDTELTSEYGATAVDLLEGGASADAIRFSSINALPYNPHKSFRLLILQTLPWWTLFVPPIFIPRSVLEKAQPLPSSTSMSLTTRKIATC